VTTRINLYGGPENLHLAYYGVDRSYLTGQVTGDPDRDRRANPLDWAGETDNFFEPHYELIQNVRLSEAASLTHTLFFFSGDGYYDDRPDTASTQRLWVKNQHYGWVPQLRLSHGRGELTVGGEWREHQGHHYGLLTWARELPPGSEPDAPLYDYTGHVHVQSAFAQESYLARPDLRVTGSLQLRHVRFGVDHDPFHGYDFHVDYTFLNPRAGLNWNVNDRWNVFAGYSHAGVEPALSDIYSADDPGAVPLFRVVDVAGGIYQDPLIQAETLNDYEAGAGFRSGRDYVRLTAFWMDFRNEIVAQGQINRYGVPIRGNAARSEHRGVELEGAVAHASGLELSGNLSWSQNRFTDYREYVDSATVNDYSDNAIAGFPGLMGNLQLAFRRGGSRVALSLAAAGTQYLDNTEDDRKNPELRDQPGYQHKRVAGYAVLNAAATLDLGPLTGARALALEVHAGNLLGKRYETAGYVYDEVPYFFPAAGRNVFVTLKAGF